MEELSTTVSISRKISDGNYGSSELFISLAGVTKDTTEEEMDDTLAQSKIAYSKVVGNLRLKVASLLEDTTR